MNDHRINLNPFYASTHINIITQLFQQLLLYYKNTRYRIFTSQQQYVQSFEANDIYQ